MRFMIIVKADRDSEAGIMPGPEVFDAMGNFNEELVRAGMLIAAEGLHPSSRGARVRFEGHRRIVTDGPFTETKELIAGFWLIQAKSREEALEWVKRVPLQSGELELRQVFETEDFGDVLTPEVRAQEERLRAETAPRKK
jgi:hypothetical protein